MKLSNGNIRIIPITLPVTAHETVKLEIGQNIGLKGMDGVLYGFLKLEEKYKYNKQEELNYTYAYYVTFGFLKSWNDPISPLLSNILKNKLHYNM
jgi:ATP sulfurylase